MTFRSIRLPACLLALVALAGCSSAEGAWRWPDPTQAERVVGTHVETWSEAHLDRDAVESARGTFLVSHQGEREIYLDGVSPELDTSALEAVDLDTHLIVVGYLYRCDESSEVVAAPDGRTLEFRVVSPANPVDCVWAPLEVVVWQVQRSLVAEDVTLVDAQDLLAWVPPQQATAPGDVVGELVDSWSENDVTYRALEFVDDDLILRTAAQRDQFVESAGPELDTSAVEAVDMDDHVLVVTSWFRCFTDAELRVSPDGSRIHVAIVSAGDEDVVCDYAPRQVEVWSVDRSLVTAGVTLADR
ncbi:MAG: hypothetical protein ACXIVQ_18190 [Acidimicrobiales bacterium]